jgi:hypothetical protein
MEGLGVSRDQIDLSLQRLFKANFLGPRNPNLNLSAFQIPIDMVFHRGRRRDYQGRSQLAWQ